jgi:DNA-binding NarL/FixJ family response regulator
MSIRRSRKTRMPALSTRTDRETVLEVLEAGADGYLMRDEGTAE